jgi:thioredoxin 1
MVIKLIIGIAIGGVLGAVMGHFGQCSSGTCPLTANPYRGAIYGGVMGALFALSFAGQKPVKVEPGSESSAVVHVTSAADFESVVLKADKPCLADFYSDKCGPCRRLAPTISALADKYEGRAIICKVSLDVAPALAQPYGIRGIPAVLVFNGGKEVGRLVGLQSQSSYEKILDPLVKGSGSAEE